MGATSIEWTDFSWPVVNGCQRVSPGCEQCYAERLTATRLVKRPKYAGLSVFGPHGPRWTRKTRLWEPDMDMPLRRKKPSKIFVCDMGDLFFEGVPTEWIDRVWVTMLLAPHHTFQVLTKRAQRAYEYLTDPGLYARVLRAADPIRLQRPGLTGVGISDPTKHPADWIWLGVSVENQRYANERVPLLLKTPAVTRFVSYEPALGPVDFREIELPDELAAAARLSVAKINALTEMDDEHVYNRHAKINQIIVGGESGPKARPFNLRWATSVVNQCAENATACFVKQLGAKPYDSADHEGPWIELKKADGRPDRKGSNMAAWPEPLRVRRFPEARVR